MAIPQVEITINPAGNSDRIPVPFAFTLSPGDSLPSSQPTMTDKPLAGQPHLTFGTGVLSGTTWTVPVSVVGGQVNAFYNAFCTLTTTLGYNLSSQVNVLIQGAYPPPPSPPPVPSNAQNPNTFYRGPNSGNPAAPFFGPLITGDMPATVPLTSTANTFTAAQTLPVQDKGGQVFNILAYGAKADAQNVYDGSITNGQKILTSASNKFSASDVGKIILVQGAGAGNTTLATSIASYQSPGQVTLTGSAGNTRTANATVLWGTDNSSAIQTLYNTLDAGIGGVIEIPRGYYMCGSSLTLTGKTAIRFRGDGFRARVNAWNSQGWMDLTQFNGSALLFTSANGLVLNSSGANAVLNQEFHDFGLIGPGSAGPSSGANGYGFVCSEALGTNFCKWSKVFLANWNIGLDSDGNAPGTGSASLTDCTLHNVSAWGCKTGINLKNCNNCNFYDTQIQSNTTGLQFYGGSGIGILGGLIQSNGIGVNFAPQANASSITVDLISLEHKIWFEGNTTSIAFDSTVTGSTIQNIKISGNHWSDNQPITFTGTIPVTRLFIDHNEMELISLVIPSGVTSWSVRDNRLASGSGFTRGSLGNWSNNNDGITYFGTSSSAIGINNNQLGFGTAAPTSGTWAQGDIVWNTAVASGQPEFWRCTTGGTPGAWSASANHP